MESEKYKDVPVATVIITIYDRTNYYLEAIDSIRNQIGFSPEQVEIIVVSNISLPIVPEGVVLLTIKQRGIGPKLKLGVERSHSDIIITLEDDDIFFYNKIKIITELFKKYPEVNYIHNAQKPFKKIDLVEQNKYFGGVEYEVIERDSIDTLSFRNFVKKYWEWSGNLSSCSFRKNVFMGKVVGSQNYIDKVGITPDLAFPILGILSSDKFINVRNPLTYYRQHNDSATKTVFRNMPKDPEILDMQLHEGLATHSLCLDKSKNLELLARAIVTKRKIARYGLHQLSPFDLFRLLQYETASGTLSMDLRGYISHILRHRTTHK